MTTCREIDKKILEALIYIRDNPSRLGTHGICVEVCDHADAIRCGLDDKFRYRIRGVAIKAGHDADTTPWWFEGHEEYVRRCREHSFFHNDGRMELVVKMIAVLQGTCNEIS